ncbi:MAG: PIG-L deacetylase family protein, partial [Promethearchaeota archaeon]
MKVLIINPHPDDAEFTCASTCQQAVSLGWDVTEILMTSDEYGTKIDSFKGERIRRIRMNEMLEAAKVYGIRDDGNPKIKLIWFGEIDGHLRFNTDVYSRLQALVLEIAPDIVIAPDAFFSMDYHPDHVHAGWLVYIIIKNLSPAKRPILLLYHSFHNNFFISMNDLMISVKAWSKHRSQTTPLGNKILSQLRKVFYFFRR